jgi:putative membrane protein insertion efficiency factor
VRTLIVFFVRVYQKLISPLLPRSCKYYPSCSQYAIDAVQTYGAARGTVLAGWRLLRCNPLSDGGYDPVENQTLFATRPRPGAAALMMSSSPEKVLEPLDAGEKTGPHGEHKCRHESRQGAIL